MATHELRPGSENGGRLSLLFCWHSRLLWCAIGTGLGVATLRSFIGARKTPSELPATDFDSFLKQQKPKPRPKPKKSQQQSTDFDAYLKVCKQQQAPTSFDAFLKSTSSSSDDIDAEAERSLQQPHAVSEPKDYQVVVTILYGTEYGFAREISEKLSSSLSVNDRYWSHMVDMAEFSGSMDLAQEQVLLVVCSTQGDGVPPSEARGFCDWLEGGEAPLLPGTSYSVCALGDTSYTHFCACGKQLDARLAALNAKQFAPRRDVNREDWKAINSWIQTVQDGLALLQLQTVEEMGGYTRAGDSSEQHISKKRPFFGTVVATESLCNVQSASDKDTIRVEIDLGDSGLEYVPGDALGIHASNAPQVVEDFLHQVGADPEELFSLPSWQYESDMHPSNRQTSLKDMLTHCYDLRTPKADLLQLLLDEWPQNGFRESKRKVPTHRASPQNGKKNGLRHQANAHAHPPHAVAKSKREELQQLAAASETELEGYLAPRHVVDVLSDFPAAKPPLEKLLRSLRPLQPRLYSISSSPLENRQHVQVTVAIVRYRSLERERQGVASTFLAERIQVGEKLPVYISKNPDFRLPADSSTPIIMVGPGTGLAPFRAFIMERLLSRKPIGESLLYFGCRRQDQDYLYGSTLEGWRKDGTIQLLTAFSRQQAGKVYVQDRLRETGQHVWDLMQRGAHFYVCGDAAHMATAVEQALLDVISQYQGQGKKDALTYLERLTKEERYQRDVWF